MCWISRAAAWAAACAEPHDARAAAARSWSRSSPSCAPPGPTGAIETELALTSPVRLRPRAHRPAPVEPAGQCPDARRARTARSGCAPRPAAAVFELRCATPASRSRRDARAPVPAVLPRLGPPDHQGLGLGLYIAAEIARAHGGTLDVDSTPEATRFTFRMPLAGTVSSIHEGV